MGFESIKTLIIIEVPKSQDTKEVNKTRTACVEGRMGGWMDGCILRMHITRMDEKEPSGVFEAPLERRNVRTLFHVQRVRAPSRRERRTEKKRTTKRTTKTMAIPSQPNARTRTVPLLLPAHPIELSVALATD